VTGRRPRLLYPEFRAAGRQIGGGPTASKCKATTARRQGSGVRWEGGNAAALRALEALEQSGEGKQYGASYRKPVAGASRKTCRARVRRVGEFLDRGRAQNLS